MRSLSDAQIDRLKEAADANDPELYYQLLSEYGFGYGILAREVATNTGIYGRVANNFLENELAGRGIEFSMDLRNRLLTNLMQADFYYRQSEDIVTVDHIAKYHRRVFGDLQIPEGAWTGVFLDSRGAQAAFCPTCSDAELAGHSRWDAVREVWGDVIDDLTGETFDIGAGPSEGASQDLLDWYGNLLNPSVGPKAMLDHFTNDPWWKPYIERTPPYRMFFESESIREESRREGSPFDPSRSTSPPVRTIQMCIAPGETRTAKVELPTLTLEIEVTMPR